MRLSRLISISLIACLRTLYVSTSYKKRTCIRNSVLVGLGSIYKDIVLLAYLR